MNNQTTTTVISLPRYLPSVIHNAEHLLSEAVNLQSSVLEDEPRFCNIQHSENNTDCAIYPRKIDGTASISSTFYARVLCMKFWGKKTSNPKHSFVIFGAKILYKKRESKTWMNLTPSVNFINILQTACKIIVRKNYKAKL